MFANGAETKELILEDVKILGNGMNDAQKIAGIIFQKKGQVSNGLIYEE